MDTDAVHEASVSADDANTGDLDTVSDKVVLLEGISSNGEVIGVLGSAGGVLTRVELDLACSSEKLANLSILMMHVATRESYLESFAAEKELMLGDSVEKALEFDLLSGILDSEVNELDNFMASLQTTVVNVREIMSSYEHLGESLMEMEEKLRDSEESLKQSQDQVSEIRMQSAKFEKIFSCFQEEGNWNGDSCADFIEDDQLFNLNAKIKMQTAEQQRHVLQMLEKSLARELDLEQKLNESILTGEEMKLRLHSSEQEVLWMEDEEMDVWEKLFEAGNAAEVLMGISKELLGRLQIFQFNLNGSMQRETELRSKLESSSETNNLKVSLREADAKLIIANSEAFTSREKVSLLEKQLKESELQLGNAKVSIDGSLEQQNVLHSHIFELENVIENLKEEVSKAESRAGSTEEKRKLLAESNMELNEELSLLKGSGGTSEKIESLEKQLRESDIKLQCAMASAEASQEKQSMLYSTIGDMEILIENLKMKVGKAGSEVDSAEEKCISLSESNAELNEELSFLRGKMKCMEASLHQAEEAKMATSKDIHVRTKVIMNLVMQLAIQRDQLHKQISSLVKENKILAVKLQENDSFPKSDLTTASRARGSKEEITEFAATDNEQDKAWKYESVDETEAGPADFKSERETVRRIDAGVLKFKHIFMALFVLVISAAVYVFQQEDASYST